MFTTGTTSNRKSWRATAILKATGRKHGTRVARLEKWKQSSALVSTGPEISSHLIHNYHKIVLDLTKEVMDRIPPSGRDVSTMTLGVIRDRVPQLKKMIQQFRQEVLKLVSVDTQPQEVVQVNIQMFPVTQ